MNVVLSHDPNATSVSKVTDAVVKLIHDEGLVPGDSLPSEGVFAQQLSVGRGVVREAFKSLEALGILELAIGKRARVSKLKSHVLGMLMEHAVMTTQVNVQQAFDLRRTLEMRTVRLAAFRRTEADLLAIRHAAKGMRGHGTGADSPGEHDIAFHVAIARATQNPLYPLLVDGCVRMLIRNTAPISWAARQNAERMAMHDLHDVIMDAIAERDAAAAEAAMAAHFDNCIQALVSAGVT